MDSVISEYRRNVSEAELVWQAVSFSLSQVNLVLFRGTILRLIVHTVRFFVGQGTRYTFLYI
ncbi:hypothetical protein ROD_39931 [Citrobacter rodentium ICC168]|uniref:Uncharacterized protein n=1 Tax=Citrobacter rodentium (strain ICC168) TaxID=637910 RepID=D2TH91_CITRI|nr:hypothetical protein ROD_39931 [Citrobacter rodentium ICC168]